MRPKLLLLFLLFLSFASFAQSGLNQWTWVKGDNYIPFEPIYGTQGVAAPSNKPGDRRSAVTWTDTSGNLWMFGGVEQGSSNPLSELWKYDPSTGWWTWISGNNSSIAGTYGTKGVAATANRPAARYSGAGWTDGAGNLWLFGGHGAASNGEVYQNDLWKYTISTGLWTWIGGDSSSNQGGAYGSKGAPASDNKPGSRYDATNWTDKTGNFWLFGGYGTSSSDVGFLNDLWKYNPATGLWTWVSGDNIADQAGAWGTKGTASPANKPETRMQGAGWTDTSGNLWLFGGFKYLNINNTSSTVQFNDLWKFSPSSGLWTWTSGDNSYNQTGVYGNKGVDAPTNKPGARSSIVAWSDTSNNLWMFGGSGFGSSTNGTLNDIWKYVPATGLWTWFRGDSTVNQKGLYGTKNTPSPNNQPGAKTNALGWATATGNLWLFGGLTPVGNFATLQNYNDLWLYTTASAEWKWTGGDSSISIFGNYGFKETPAPDNKPGTRVAAAGWADGTGNLWLFGGYGASGSGNPGYLNDLWKYAVSSGQWSWISGDSSSNPVGVYGTQGVPAPANKPWPRYYALTWTDAAGKLWLFGGNSLSFPNVGSFNDLWRFDPATGLWTWMSGDSAARMPGVYGVKGIAAAGNKPGARSGATGWADATGNLWLFGGSGSTTNGSGSMNDLWKYTIVTGLWTWVSGDNTFSQYGMYGPPGVASAVSKPGARSLANGWADAAGNFWLFGGGGLASSNSSGWLNDLWRYTPSSGLWTYIGGSSTANASSVYGTKGIAAPNNQPGGRYNASSWLDATGNLWLFGGEVPGAIPPNSNSPILNDLWKYNPVTNRWAWMSGDNTTNQPPQYGTQGVSASSNKPGARSLAVSWTDAAGSLWLFGGNGYASNGTGSLNDLWKYTLQGAALPVQFIAFSAYKQQQTVMLSWKTALEQNSRSFVIERSADGSRYDSIGTVPATNTASSSYSFPDKEPLQGSSFYRIKQVDRDDNFLYSGTARITGQDATRFAASYNSAQNSALLHIELPAAAKIILQLRDMNGHLLWTEERPGTRGSSVYAIPVGSLAKGTYLITMQAGGMSKVATFVKQ